MRRRTGYLVDPGDARDVLLGDALGDVDIPLTASVRSGKAVIKDQGMTSSCVGMSVANALREALLFRGVICPDLSALFAYLMSRAEHGGQRADVGTYVRTCIKAVQRLGCAAEAKHRFSWLRVNRGPTPDAFADAFARRGLRRYYRIPGGDVRGMRAAIASGCTVVAGWQFSEAIYDYRGEASGIPDGTGPVGHAVYLDGYDQAGFEGQNSWGRSWGADGRFNMTDSLAAKATDVWGLDTRS